MNFPILCNICAQYVGELKLVVSKLIPLEELPEIILAENHSMQVTVECQVNVISLPVSESFGNSAWHSIRM